MNKKVLFVSISVLILTIAFFIIPKPQRKKPSKDIISIPKIDDKDLRNYTIKVNLRTTLDLPTDDGIFRIYGNEEKILAIDYHQEVNEIAENGDIARDLIIAGGAPFENGQISSVKKSKDYYALVDIEKNVIKIQNSDNDIKQYRKLATPIYNGIYVKDNKFLLLTDNTKDSAIELYSIKDGQVLSSLKIIDLLELEESNYPEIISEGIFTYNTNGDTFYVPGRMGKYLVFDSFGKFKSIGKTLDATDAPTVYSKKIGNTNATMFVREPDYFVNYSATADNNYLYILSLHGNKNDHNYRTIDAYDFKSNRYSHSLAIPYFNEQRPVEIASISGNVIVVLYENQELAFFEIAKDEI